MTLVQSSPKAIKIWTTDIKAVYLWETKVRPSWPSESIIYKMDADSSGNLYVPNLWYDQYGRTTSTAYNWKISVDGWTETTYSGSTWTSDGITLSWYTASSNHTITIKPVSEDYWWARAFCWGSLKSAKRNITEIVYDWSYMWYAVSATAVWWYSRYYQYYWCSKLTNAAEEVMPDTVTTIWVYYRAYQYSYDTLITSSPEEALSNSVTSIWGYFRTEQFRWCSALNEVKWWKDLSVWNSYYRQTQYYWTASSKTVKVLSNVWYWSYNEATLPNNLIATVQVPSAYLNNFINASVNPRLNITDSKFVWY